MSIRFPSLVKDILVAAGSQKGNKVKLRFKLPDWIKQGSFEIKKAFLQALFDDESTVNIKSRQIWVSLHKRIEIIDNLHQFFEEMGCMLKEFGINGITITQCHLRESSNGKTLEKRLTICGLLNFRKFKENINFLHPHKRKKLGILIRSIKHIKPGTKECRRKIINVLKRNPGLKFSDIAKLASVSPAATFNHLRKMEKNDLVIRTKFSNKTPFQWFLVEEQFMWFFHHQN